MTDENNKRRVNFWLSEGEIAKLDRIAEVFGFSRNELMRRIIAAIEIEEQTIPTSVLTFGGMR